MSSTGPSNLPTGFAEQPTGPDSAPAASGSVTNAPTSTPGRTSLGEVNPDAPTLRPGSASAGRGSDAATVENEAVTARATDGRGTRLEAPRPHEGPRGRTRIGLYEVMEELGRGGMGAVYRAWHPMRRKYVALKVIKPDVAQGEKLARLKELFLREAGILMSIAHENVVGCHDANEADHDGKPVLYMALELLEGRSLAARLLEGPMPAREAGEVARSLARALRALHENEQRILHRDLKPANAFLSKDGGVKLLDFGLAGVADWKLTQVSMFAAGSRPYMPPEQFDGLRYCTERSDLYSLGCTIFQMVTCRTPFASETDGGYMRAHRDRSPPTLREALPSLPEGDPVLEGLQNVVTKLLAKRQDERYASAAEVVAALDTLLGGGTILPPKVTRPEAVRLRNRIAGALLVVAVAALVWWVAIASVRSGSARTIAAGRAALERARLEGGESLEQADLAAADAKALEVLSVDARNQDALALRREVDAERRRRADAAAARVLASQTDAEARAKAEAWLARCEADLAAARAALEKGERAAAAGLLRSLAEDGRSIPPQVAAEERRLRDDLAAADAIAAEWRLARDASESGQHDEAGRRAGRVRALLRDAGPKGEARAGVLPADVDALLAPLAERARALRHEAAMRRAAEALRAGGSDDAREAALEALRDLPLEAAEAFRSLARAFERDRAARGDPLARDALREALRAKGCEAAQAAWLLLESATARLGLDPAREALFERQEGVVLGSDDERWRRGNPLHRAALAPFYLDKDEVTIGAYAKAVAAGRVRAPETWPGGRPPPDLDSRPVGGVLAEDAAAFARGETPARRLPSADEWELAATVADLAHPEQRTAFAFGATWDPAILDADAEREPPPPPPPVGTLALDRRPWGGRDMASGVSEWCLDPSGRALPLGGSWLGRSESEFVAWRRAPMAPLKRSLEDRLAQVRGLGLRCARDVPAPGLAEFAR